MSDSTASITRLEFCKWLLATCAMALTFMVVEPVFHRCGHLNSDCYRGDSILLSSLSHSNSALVTAIFTLGFAIWQRRLTWQDLGCVAGRLQLPAIAIVFSLSWFLCTSATNYWWGNSFWPDRLLLAVIGLLTVVRPASIGAFLLLAYMLTGQYNEPLQFSWTDKLVIYQLGLVIFLYLVGRTVVGRRMPENSPYLLICAVLGQWYLVPAIGKFSIDWLTEDNLANLVASARHQNGWLGWLPADAFGRLLKLIESSNILMLLGGMCTEFAVIFFLLSRRMTFVLLALCAFLHISIFATSGIFFWKWILFEVALIIGLSRIPLASCTQVFGWRQWAISCGIMGLLVITSPRVVNLAWYDEPYAYRFRFEATGMSGSRYELIARDFAPYDLPFAQARFYFLTDRKQLVGTFGTTQDGEIHDFFQQSWQDPVSEINRAVDLLGQPQTNSLKVLQMRELLSKFMHAANDKVITGPNLADRTGFLFAPNHIQTAQRADASLPRYRHQEELQAVDVFLVERLLDDERSQVIYEGRVLQVADKSVTR